MELVYPLVVLLIQCRSILCLHLVNVLSLWCFNREALLRLRFFLRRPYASRICSIFPLGGESKALVKSINSNVASRFFARTPSRILRMVNICEVVDLFLRKSNPTNLKCRKFFKIVCCFILCKMLLELCVLNVKTLLP